MDDPIAFIRDSICFPPSRLGILAAVTSTCNTQPSVSTVVNRLRPVI